MSPHKVFPELELSEDLAFERKSWRAERIAWVLMLLVVLAGLSGVLGRGGLSSKTLTSAPAGLEAEYEQFLRYETPDRILLKVKPDGKATTYSLLIGKEFFEKISLEEISPRPTTEQVSADGITYTFSVAPGQPELRLHINLKPNEWGSVKTLLRDNNGRSLTLNQFIYP